MPSLSLWMDKAKTFWGVENHVTMKKSGIIKAEAKLVVKDFVEVMGGIEPGRRIVSYPFMLGDTPLDVLVSMMIFQQIFF